MGWGLAIVLHAAASEQRGFEVAVEGVLPSHRGADLEAEPAVRSVRARTSSSCASLGEGLPAYENAVVREVTR